MVRTVHRGDLPAASRRRDRRGNPARRLVHPPVISRSLPARRRAGSSSAPPARRRSLGYSWFLARPLSPTTYSIRRDIDPEGKAPSFSWRRLPVRMSYRATCSPNNETCFWSSCASACGGCSFAITKSYDLPPCPIGSVATPKPIGALHLTCATSNRKRIC